MTLRLKGGRVIDPKNKVDKKVDLYIDDGRIAAVGNLPAGVKITSTIDVGGKFVLPGLVDFSAHLREPGYEHKGNISTELKAAVAGGFTTVCCTPDTRPVIDNGSVVEHIKQRATRERSARVFCLGALTANLDGKVLAEMAALKQSGCIAVTNLNQAISDTSVLRHALAYAASCDLMVFLHPYEYWLSQGGEMHEGHTSTRLGIAGIPSAAEIIAVQRDLILVEETGVRAHFCHLSCGESVRLVAAAKRKGLPVSADVAITNLLFDENDMHGYDGNFHIDPPLRTRKDKSQLTAGVGRQAIDVITSNHEPHDADAKLAPFSLTEPGVSSFDTFLSALFELTDNGKLDLPTAIAAVTTNSSDILGIEGGELGKGARADLCVYDPKRNWCAEVDTLHSTGKNTPLLGREFSGKVVLTIINGRTVFDELH